MRLPRHARTARTAINNHLKEHADEPHILLFTLSAVADNAAIDAGRKSELFPSLADYERLLPPGSHSRWIERGSGSILVATNPHYRGAPSPELQSQHQPVPGPFDAATDAHVFPV